MPLYIKEDDVDSLVDVSDAIAALEEGFRHWRRDGTENLPRQRFREKGGERQRGDER